MPYIYDCGDSSLGGGGGGGGGPTAGTTDMLTGTTTTTQVNVPAIPGNFIEQMSIRCAIDQPSPTRLEFSFDGGATFFRLKVGETYTEEPRQVKQITIKASGTAITSANYEILLNRGITA